MDEDSPSVREVFIRYYEDGIIYRAQRLINWDPFAQTALSNLEVENEEDFKTEIWSLPILCLNLPYVRMVFFVKRLWLQQPDPKQCW